MVITIPVKADDILILASDGLSDNLWDEDVLDEVVRFRKSFLDSTPVGGSDTSVVSNDSGYSSTEDNAPSSSHSSGDSKLTTTTTLKRKTLAGMLSEALCSRAKRVSEHRTFYHSPAATSSSEDVDTEVDEVPFARRAREVGKRFIGGKKDDISVVVAVISPKSK